MEERAGRILTRERLFERVWGGESEVEMRSIDARIRRLRLKRAAELAAFLQDDVVAEVGHAQ